MIVCIPKVSNGEPQIIYFSTNACCFPSYTCFHMMWGLGMGGGSGERLRLFWKAP